MGLGMDAGETERSQCSSRGHSRTPGDALCLNEFARRGLTDPFISPIVLEQMRTAPTTRLKGESVLKVRRKTADKPFTCSGLEHI
jgi:hypothetical protein